MKLQYCTRCIYPSTKPRLEFDEHGVCSACLAFDRRQQIDWAEREKDFRLLAEQARQGSSPYHCIIPVSGGKDSHYQVLKALEYGLRPLAVTAMTDHLTEVGRHNLNNISKLGVDHVMVQTDQRLRRSLNRLCLESIGDISWPEHVTIFTVPVREALLRGIPLILYGENPENEYGGPFEAQGTHQMTREWLEEFGGLCGLRVSDLIEQSFGTAEDFYQYTYPNRPGLWSVNEDTWKPLQAVFLGYYFPWDGAENVKTAEAAGFDSWGVPSGAWLRGENLDNAQTGIHDRFKFLKFGFGRVTDHLCNAIRRGKISREEAVKTANSCDGSFPSMYMGVKITDILYSIGMASGKYGEVERKFANPELFDFDTWGSPQRKFQVE